MPRFAPWYRRQDYALVREIMEDAETFPRAFDEWEKNAENERAAAKRDGVNMIPVFLDPESSSRSAKKRKSGLTVRPLRHSPAAEGRRIIRWGCEPVSLHEAGM
jgi:hypothetical protein